MSLQWFEWHTAHERIQGRLHALNKGQKYGFRYDQRCSTAYTDFKSRQIGVNPLAMDKVFESEGLKGKARDEANYLMSRGLMGHENLHVLYTDPEAIEASKSHPDLKMVTNLLEDARIENIGAEESCISAKLFKLISATVMKMLPEFKDPNLDDPYSAVQLLQCWREGYAIPEVTDEARKKWIKLRNMAEDALYAKDTWEVLKTSHKVCELLGIGKHTPPEQPKSKLGDQLKDLNDKRSGDIKGKRQQRPKDNPLEDPRPKKDQEDEEDQTSGGAPQQQDQQDDQQRSQGGGQSQDQKSDQGQPQDDQGSGSGGPKGDEDDSQPDQDESDQPGEPDEDDPGQGSDQGEEEEEDQQGPSSQQTDDETDQGQPQPQPHPQDDSDGDEEDEDEDPSAGRQDDPKFSLKDIVNDAQNAVKEKLDQDIPTDEQRNMVRGAASYDPCAYRNNDIIGRSYMDIYLEAKPIAQEIIRELKTTNPKVVKGASEYPGRLRMRYLLRDEEKPFAKKTLVGKSVPKMAISLIIDRSESMKVRVQELKIMAMAVYLACEEVQIPLSIWVLEGAIHLKKFDEWGAHVLSKIAGITAITGTNMTPTLSSASDDLKKRPEPLKQVVTLHDGGPADRQDVIDWRKKLGRVSLYCMLVVPGSKQPNLILPRKHEMMDELVGAGNYCIAFMEEVPKFWTTFIKLKREALAR